MFTNKQAKNQHNNISTFLNAEIQVIRLSMLKLIHSEFLTLHIQSSPLPSPQTLGPLGETVLWGQGPSGLPPGPLPGPGRRQPASAMPVKGHVGSSVPREGAFRLPESLGGQWRVTRIQWVKLSQAVWLGV